LHKKFGRRGTVEDEHVSCNIEADNHEDTMETDDFSLLPEEQDRRDGTGETRHTLSWIWLTRNTTNPDDEGDDILQIEWAKSRACAACTTEEVLLIREEIRRVIQFLSWKSKSWALRAKNASELMDKGFAEGLCAYACKQSLLQDNLSHHFQAIWKTPLLELDTDGLFTVGGDGVDEDNDDDGGEGHDSNVEFANLEDSNAMCSWACAV
jgi:hypothetical protein